jgi:glycosyltransferase involved in cell wall biosynthesis
LLFNKIIFSGKQLNVTAYLNHAEIFVLPTLDEGRREGSPVALLEAMANGKVVIGSKVSGIKDQLANYPLHLFTSKDSCELAEKLDYFMNLTKDNLIEIGLGFTTLAVEKYSIDVEIKKHEELYKSAVNS